MRNRWCRQARFVAVLTMLLILVGLLGVALAQSGVASFSLNSPAAFPVDI